MLRSCALFSNFGVFKCFGSCAVEVVLTLLLIDYGFLVSVLSPTLFWCHSFCLVRNTLGEISVQTWPQFLVGHVDALQSNRAHVPLKSSPNIFPH